MPGKTLSQTWLLILLFRSLQTSRLFLKHPFTQNIYVHSLFFTHTLTCGYTRAHTHTHILLWNSCNNNSPLPPSPPQLCSPHPSIPLPCGHLLLILKLIWEPPAPLYKEMYCAQIIWLFSDVGPFLHKRGRTGFVQSRRLLGPWMDTPGGGGGKKGIGVGLGERTHESGSDPCNARLQTMCSLNFCSPCCGTYHFCDSQGGGAWRKKEGRIVSAYSFSLMLHPFSEFARGSRRVWGSRARKALHWWKVSTWKWMTSGLAGGRVGGVVVVGDWLATSRHELGCKGEEREGGEGWKAGNEKKDKGSDGECENLESKRNTEGRITKTNGLIQGLSSTGVLCLSNSMKQTTFFFVWGRNIV